MGENILERYRYFEQKKIFRKTQILLTEEIVPKYNITLNRTKYSGYTPILSTGEKFLVHTEIL